MCEKRIESNCLATKGIKLADWNKENMGYKLGFINSVLAVFSAYLINYTIPRASLWKRKSNDLLDQ